MCITYFNTTLFQISSDIFGASVQHQDIAFVYAFTHTHKLTKLYRHRGKGKTTLWNPGCDHAGIATQVNQNSIMYR